MTCCSIGTLRRRGSRRAVLPRGSSVERGPAVSGGLPDTAWVEWLDHASTPVQGLAAFDPVWETLVPKEQARIVQLLVDLVDQGENGKIALTFHTTGLRAMID